MEQNQPVVHSSGRGQFFSEPYKVLQAFDSGPFRFHVRSPPPLYTDIYSVNARLAITAKVSPSELAADTMLS